MSRLWPERLRLGLFAERCWLEQGKARERRLYECESSGTMLLEAACSLLERAEPAPYDELCVTVSDNVARIVILPWQPKLKSQLERVAYARACFEQVGITLDSRWLIRAEYRNFGTPGMGYALPATLVQGLVTIATERKLRLASILPGSAAAYFAMVGQGKHVERIMLLVESQRISLLQYANGKMGAYDAEPVIGALEDTMRRLLRRAAPELAPSVQVMVWSPTQAEGLERSVESVCGQAELKVLEPGVWGKV